MSLGTHTANILEEVNKNKLIGLNGEFAAKNVEKSAVVKRNERAEMIYKIHDSIDPRPTKKTWIFIYTVNRYSSTD